MNSAAWALTLAYWLHMLATVLWIGGLVAISLLVLPAARKTLDSKTFILFLVEIQRRFDPLAWFSLGILAGTGLFQMSANPNYKGFLVITDSWMVAIFVKHILFLGMAGVSAAMTWIILPALRRTAFQLVASSAVGDRISEDEKLRRKETRLLQFNLLLGVLILALTALARVS